MIGTLGFVGDIAGHVENLATHHRTLIVMPVTLILMGDNVARTSEYHDRGDQNGQLYSHRYPPLSRLPVVASMLVTGVVVFHGFTLSV